MQGAMEKAAAVGDTMEEHKEAIDDAVEEKLIQRARSHALERANLKPRRSTSVCSGLSSVNNGFV